MPSNSTGPEARYTNSVSDIGRYVRLEQQVAELNQRLRDVDAALSGMSARIDKIAEQSLLTQTAVTAAFNAGRVHEQSLTLPPVPPELISACGMPRGTLNWVKLTVGEQEVHRKVTGGSDPSVIWRDICNSVKNTNLSEPLDGSISPSDRASQGSPRPGS
ncbi:hypothetical protein GCM10023196_037690 [Actinoallomurus vinaceus]|uniref:Uncharacterized protein n=1 Tax=Actinoallomurus vinaceus TaxID=1080074 RepID=A0ABP8UB82_9ACTN